MLAVVTMLNSSLDLSAVLIQLLLIVLWVMVAIWAGATIFVAGWLGYNHHLRMLATMVAIYLAFGVIVDNRIPWASHLLIGIAVSWLPAYWICSRVRKVVDELNVVLKDVDDAENEI